MTARAPQTIESGPDWLAAEMPPGYQTRLSEINRLTEELRLMDRFGRLLWEVGDTLAEAVRDGFAVLGFESALIGNASVGVKLDGRRRLLVHCSSTKGAIQKKSSEIALVFRMVHELAEEGDRVVLATNGDPNVRPADRPEPVTAEALELLRRLGVNVLPGPTLFALWMLSLQAKDRVPAQVDRLHAQDGGVFALPATVTR